MSRSKWREPGSRRRVVPVLALAALAGGVLVPALVDSGAAGAAPGTQAAKAAAKTVKPGKGTTVDKSSVRTVHGKGSSGSTGDGSTAVPKSGPITLLLELDTQATGEAFNASRGRGVIAARTAARGQFSRVTAMQSAVRAALPSAAPGAKVVYQTSAVLPGVAVKTDAKYFDRLKAVAGVKAVYPVSQKVRSNAGAVPLQGGNTAWQTTGQTGAGVRVGIIDTGIDYTHADFGGPGTVAAFEAAQASNVFTPTAKVVGGYDFAGDDYDGADPTSVPVPDPNPLDCEGHGSHVAGSAAGFGVKADGTTYRGPYNASTDFGALKIGPGMAPEALLYALRVFGCEGSTNLVGQALDYAADPNGDRDFSDHLDVINMSLGSDFGDSQDGDAIASNRLMSIVGTTVVASIGNGSDVYDVGGSPGNASQVLGVAASDDGFAVVDALRVTAPPALATDHPGSLSVQYDYDTKPGISNKPLSAVLADRDACAPLSTADAAKVAGKVATVYADAFACGSVAKANNVQAAGAIGMVIISDDDTLESGINGNPNIPAILVIKSAGDAIAAQLNAGVTVTVTFGKETRNAVKRNLPQDADKLASFSSRGIRRAGNLKPDVTAVGSAVFSVGVGTGNDGTSLGGTSMASPMVAGLAALVRQRHPDWTPAEVKADIMNTATADIYTGDNKTGQKYAPGRVGTGRIVAPDAVTNDVLAYVVDDPGAVSVSFGPVAAVGPVTASKRVRIANKGSKATTVALSYAPATVVPGVTFSVSPASVTVDPKSSKDVTVTMTGDPAQMTKTIDPTVEAPSDDNPRQFLAEASGRLIAATADGKQRRVSVHASPRPASAMSAAPGIVLPTSSATAPDVRGELPLSGKGVSQGSGATAIQSLVTGLELQGVSPALRPCAAGQVVDCILVPDEAGGDLKWVGAVSDSPGVRAGGGDPFTDGFAYFGVTNWGRWRTPTGSTDFAVVIDTNRDGTPDAQLVTTRATDTDILLTALYDWDGNPIGIDGTPASATNPQELEFINGVPGQVDTDVFDSDSLVLPVSINALPGVDAAHPRVNWGIVSLSGYGDTQIDSVGFSAAGAPTLSIDLNRPAISLTGEDSPGPVYVDLPNTTLPVRKDVRAASFDKAYGLLLIHHHNVDGARGQAVKVQQPSPPRFRITSASTLPYGQRFTFYGDVPGIYGLQATGNLTVTRAPNVVIWSGKVGANGRVTGTLPVLGRGTYQLRLNYAGDSQYAAGSSATVTVRVV